jgi:SAM-dependent methyltransferase
MLRGGDGVLTVDFGRFPIRPGDRVLDVGCGAGRHAFEAYRRGARVVAVDLAEDDLPDVRGTFRAMQLESEAPSEARAHVIRGDVLSLPLPDESFDVVIASEILEHVPDDAGAIAELARVLRPGGWLAVTVPRWWPERVCWALSEAYHTVEGGHVRIYSRRGLLGALRRAGFDPVGIHHAHALHAPYWWLRCLVGVDREDVRMVEGYRRFLEWDIERRPVATRTLERILNPVLGKSLVLYLRKAVPSARAGRRSRRAHAAA